MNLEESEEENMEIHKEILDNEIFFIDILNIQSFKNADIYLQSSKGDMTEQIRSILIDSELSWGLKIKLTIEHKMILLSELMKYHIHIYFSSIELRQFNTTLFKIYDGCEFAEFSKNLKIPKWFVEKYQNKDRYVISDEW